MENNSFHSAGHLDGNKPSNWPNIWVFGTKNRSGFSTYDLKPCCLGTWTLRNTEASIYCGLARCQQGWASQVVNGDGP